MTVLLVLVALLGAWLLVATLRARPGSWDQTRQFARARRALGSTRGGDRTHAS